MISTIKPDLKGIFLTDPHFLSRRTPSANTFKGVCHAIPLDDSMKDYKIILIGGDWFDRLATLAERDIYYAQAAVVHLLNVCEKYDIKLRIVDGTKSHDRFQSIMFEETQKMLDKKVDVKYFKDLTVEIIDDLDLSILYVPDEWHHDPNETLRQVKELIKSRGLSRVDLGVIHGGFKYQFNLDLPSLHDEVEYSALVNYAVFSGHIHKFSRCLNIICGGSFNRNNHDEDDPKGHVRFEITGNKLSKVEFIENEYAKIYKTINIFDMDYTQVYDEVKKLGTLPMYSAIRLEYREGDPIQAIREVLESIFPDYIFTDVKRVEKKEREAKRLFSKETTKPISFNTRTVPKLVLERLTNKGESDEILRIAEKTFKEIITEG